MKNKWSKAPSLNRKLLDDQKFSARNREKRRKRHVQNWKKGFSHSLQALVKHFSSSQEQTSFSAVRYSLIWSEDKNIKPHLVVEKQKQKEGAGALHFRSEMFLAFVEPYVEISYVTPPVRNEGPKEKRIKKPQTDAQVISKFRTSMQNVCRAKRPIPEAITETFNTLMRLSLKGIEGGTYSDALDSELRRDGNAFLFSIDAEKAVKYGELGDKGEVSVCGFSWWPSDGRKRGRLYVNMPNNEETLDLLSSRIISVALCKRESAKKKAEETAFCPRQDQREPKINTLSLR